MLTPGIYQLGPDRSRCTRPTRSCSVSASDARAEGRDRRR
jgi:hypothetical protein